MKYSLFQFQHFVLGNSVSALTYPVFEFPGHCRLKHSINVIVYGESTYKMQVIISVHRF